MGGAIGRVQERIGRSSLFMNPMWDGMRVETLTIVQLGDGYW